MCVKSNNCSYIVPDGCLYFDVFHGKIITIRSVAAIVELRSQQVADLDLRDVVYDEFVVEKRAADLLGVFSRTHRNRDVVHFDEIARVRRGTPNSLRGMFSRGEISSVVIRLILLIHLSQRHLTKQKNPRTIFPRSKTVIRRFRRHIRKVNTFTKHIPRHRSLRRSNSQPLTKNTHKVRQPTAMPQQHLIVNILREADILSLAIQSKQILEIKRVGSMRRPMRTLQIPVDSVKFLRSLIDRPYLPVQPEIVRIDLVLILTAVLQDVGRQFDLGKGFKHLQLLLDLDLIVEDEVTHMSETKIVRNKGVEVIGKLTYDLRSVFTLDFVHQLLQNFVAMHDVVFGEITQGHLGDVVADLRHLLVHHVQIEDQFDQSLDWIGQFALVEFLLFVLLIWLCSCVLLVLGWITIAKFYLPVVSILMFIVIFGVVLTNSTHDGAGSDVHLLPLHAYTAPTSVEIAVIAVVVALDNLKNVKFIVIILN